MNKKESYLLKEINKKDVRRLRNIISGKHNDNTTVQVGYKKQEIEHKEGDVWEENGKVWTITNGIKHSKSKTKEIKKYGNIPLFCPKCNEPMNHKNHRDSYEVHGFCFNCLSKFETDLKVNGKWEEYQNKIHNESIDNYLEKMRNMIEEEINDTNSSFFSEGGELQQWLGSVDKEKVREAFKQIEEYYESLKK